MIPSRASPSLAAEKQGPGLKSQARMKISNRECKFQARIQISCLGEWARFFSCICQPAAKGGRQKGMGAGGGKKVTKNVKRVTTRLPKGDRNRKKSPIPFCVPPLSFLFLFFFFLVFFGGPFFSLFFVFFVLVLVSLLFSLYFW